VFPGGVSHGDLEGCRELIKQNYIHVCFIGVAIFVLIWCVFVMTGFSSELDTADGGQTGRTDTGYDPHAGAGID
jgi:hypothetical protein